MQLQFSLPVEDEWFIKRSHKSTHQIYDRHKVALKVNITKLTVVPSLPMSFSKAIVWWNTCATLFIKQVFPRFFKPNKLPKIITTCYNSVLHNLHNVNSN